jgi:hypothetical protein
MALLALMCNGKRYLTVDLTGRRAQACTIPARSGYTEKRQILQRFG